MNSTNLALLNKIYEAAEPVCPWVFPACSGDGHLVDVRKPLAWAMARGGLSDFRGKAWSSRFDWTVIPVLSGQGFRF
jgi:hypothetical protein